MFHLLFRFFDILGGFSTASNAILQILKMMLVRFLNFHAALPLSVPVSTLHRIAFFMACLAVVSPSVFCRFCPRAISLDFAFSENAMKKYGTLMGKHRNFDA